MLTDQLTDEELQLASRALSIHRVQMRRKLMKLAPGEPSFNSTLREIKETQALVSKLNGIDLARLAS